MKTLFVLFLLTASLAACGVRGDPEPAAISQPAQ